MNIGEASKLSGLTVKATRYYANIDLVKPRQDIQTGYKFHPNCLSASTQYATDIWVDMH